MNNYKLSIIIPTFNSENDINKTFDSVKSQTIGFENIELIFVDDNSTDNTFQILNEYSNNNSNVNVFKTDENSGFAGKPRNIGLEKSTSKYVLFLDGDDQLLVDSCEVLLNNIITDNNDIVIGSYINRYSDDVLEHNQALFLGGKEVFETTDDMNLLNIAPAISAKLFKRELLVKNSIRFAENIPGQDLIFLIESILHSKKITVLNNQYIYYRNIHDKSISYKITEKYLIGLTKAYELLADLFKKYSIDPDIQEIIFKKHLGFFTSQVLRACNLSKLNAEELDRIMNSDSFNNLSKKTVFIKNEYYKKYFEYMSDGRYAESKRLINNLKSNINFDTTYLDIKNKNKILKEHNTALTEQNNKINNKCIELKKDIDNLNLKTNELKKSNEYLENELNEIKSSKLWRLINKF